MKIKRLLLCFMLTGFFANAQTQGFHFERKISHIQQQWHKIILPNAMFGKLNDDFSDLRIIGVTPKKDTLQAPYFLTISRGKTTEENVDFELLNRSKTNNGFYFTFKVTEKQPINELKLKFQNDNFDWKVQLQGSQKQQKWFTILEDYRILSIKNEAVDYQFGTLHFPKAHYRFFRIFIQSKEKPVLSSVSLALKKTKKPNYRNFAIASYDKKESQKSQETVLNIQLKHPVPLSLLQLKIANNIDYYRPVRIDYLTDSTKTETGWHKHYRNLTHGVLSSVEKNEFTFRPQIAQQLRVTIEHDDNSPLRIKNVAAKGFQYELIARFTEKATYVLTYGNRHATKPRYDITRFKNKVPDSLQTLPLGKEIRLSTQKHPQSSSSFFNKYWLWGLMLVIIVALGTLTFSMLRKR